MKIITKHINTEGLDHITIIPISDMHVGSIAFDEQKFKDTVKWIKNHPNTYVVGIGDYMESINVNDPRFDSKSIGNEYIDVSSIINMQIRKTIDLLHPIRKQILSLIDGNHENKLRKKTGVDTLELIANDLHVQHGYGQVYNILDLGKYGKLIIWSCHGWFAGRKAGSKVNQMMDVVSSIEADIYLCGHSHDLFEVSADRCIIENNKPSRKRKTFINTGSFFDPILSQGSVTYSEEKGFPLLKTGVARIDVYLKTRPNRYDVHTRI